MMSAQVINIIALALVGLGALRASEATVPELGRWRPLLAGTASVWAAGAMFGQAAWLYKMLYKREDIGFNGREAIENAQVLSTAMPIIITCGIALLAIAIGGFAARIGNEDLRGHAQSKGAGFVTLSLVAVAIQNWMIPKAMMNGSLGGFAMLSLLAAGAGLVAIVMMARLLNLAAEQLEREPGLPPATVVES
jgi:hypothetical protein